MKVMFNIQGYNTLIWIYTSLISITWNSALLTTPSPLLSVIDVTEITSYIVCPKPETNNFLNLLVSEVM